LPEAGHRQGLILDKKKGLLVGNENETGLCRQHLEERFKKPIADLLDIGIRHNKSYACGNQ